MNITPSHQPEQSSSPDPYSLDLGIGIAESKPLDIPSREELRAYEGRWKKHRALPTDATRALSACTLFGETMTLWQRQNIDELSKLSPDNSLSRLMKEIKLLESSASSLRAVGQVASCFANPLPVVLRAFASHAFNRLREKKADLKSGYASSAIERACYGAKLMSVRAAEVGLEIGDQVTGIVGVGGQSKLQAAPKGPKLKDRHRPTAEEAAAAIAAKKAKVLSGAQKAQPAPEEEDQGEDAALSADQIAYRDERKAQEEILNREKPSDDQKKIFALRKSCPPPYDDKKFREDTIQKAMVSCAGWLGSEINLLLHRKLDLSPALINVSIEECLKGAIDTPQKKGKEAIEAELTRHSKTAGILHGFLRELALEIKNGDPSLAQKHLSRAERAFYEQLVKPPKEDLPMIELA